MAHLARTVLLVFGKAAGIVVLCVGLAAGIAVLRNGQFSEQLPNVLWVLAVLLLATGLFSFSPSRSRASDEVIAARTGVRPLHGITSGLGTGMAVILVLAGLALVGIALLVA